jgi:hypothetical protein
MSNTDETKQIPQQNEGDIEKNAEVSNPQVDKYPSLKVSIPIVLCIYMVVFLCALVS